MKAQNRPTAHFLGLLLPTVVSMWWSTALADRGIVSWGSSIGAIPGDLTNVATVAIGGAENLALLTDGTVVVWGTQPVFPPPPPTQLSHAKAIASGPQNSMVLFEDGTVLVWGDNSEGQANVPPGLTNVIAIACGVYHCMALRENGTVVVWGDGLEGQRNVPPGLTNVVGIAAGLTHCLALKADGIVVGWGSLSTGPAKVPGGLTNVVSVAAGATHSLALKADGTAVAWGTFGNGSLTGALAYVPDGLDQIVAIGCCLLDCLILRADGTVVGWGLSLEGETNVPPGLRYGLSIAAGIQTSVAIVGQAPPVITTPPRSATVVEGGQVFFSVAVNGTAPLAYQWLFNGLALPGANDRVLAIGDAQTNQAADYSVIVSNPWGAAISSAARLNVVGLLITAQPKSETTFPGATVSLSVEAQGQGPLTFQWRFNGTDLPGQTNSTLMLNSLRPDQDGAYSVTVSNRYGSVQSADALVSFSPVVVWGGQDSVLSTPTGLTEVVAIDTAAEYSLALKANGTVTAWGYDLYGQLDIPPGLSNVVAISAGAGASRSGLALRSDGTVVPLGHPLGGTPIPGNLTNAVAIAVGGGFALALRADGTVTGWGNNSEGQLDIPPGLTNVVEIAAGDSSAYALLAGGTVVLWGSKFDPGITNVPADLTNVTDIAAGLALAVALKSDGTVEVFEGGTKYASPPGLHDVVGIGAGYSHALAIKSDGTVVSWGDNYFGQGDVPSGLQQVQAVTGSVDRSLALIGEPPARPVLHFELSDLSNGSVAVQTVRGRKFWVEFKDSLPDPVWHRSPFPPLPGDNTIRRLSAPLPPPGPTGAAGTGRYFRVKVQ